MEIQRINITEMERQLVSSFMGEEYPQTIDFNWLMPVVEKIESIKDSDDYEVDIFGNCCEIGCMDEHSAVGKTKIEAVYNAVVEFIQWYNNQKLNQ